MAAWQWYRGVSMRIYPRILSALLVAPFVGLAFLLYGVQADPVFTKLYAVLQLCYASLIVCFLSGVHRTEALKERDNKRLTLSMMPVMMSAGLLFWGFTKDPIHPLLVAIIMFWTLYIMDKKYYDMRHLPEDYLPYRFKFTMAVTTVLVFSYLILT